MKSKIINTTVCDARGVQESSLQNFDSIVINAAALLTDAPSRAILNRYPFTLNAATALDIPEGQNVRTQTVNGKYEIGPDTDGTDVFLVINGKVTLLNDSLHAARSFTRILVNGKILLPKSHLGQLQNLTLNGKAEPYPDGAVLIKDGADIDSLMLARASHPFYYCPGTLYFLSADLDIGKLKEKALRFGAKKIIVAESLLTALLPHLEEDAVLIRVPDGTRRIDDDTELTCKTIKKYGGKLCVRGDVRIHELEALLSLQYLHVQGTVYVDKHLEEAFEAVQSAYDALKILDPDVGYLTDRPVIKVNNAMLQQYAGGLRIEDCAKVTLAPDLSPTDILARLAISDCAIVRCTKDQEDAVHMIARDVAMIQSDGGETDRSASPLDTLFGQEGDTQIINAIEYRL